MNINAASNMGGVGPEVQIQLKIVNNNDNDNDNNNNNNCMYLLVTAILNARNFLCVTKSSKLITISQEKYQ